MKEITKFGGVTGDPTRIGSLDTGGSAIDAIFAAAVVANEPTTVLEEAGIIRVVKIPEGVDEAKFPIVRNTQLTWTTLTRDTTGGAGSDNSAQALNEVEFRRIRPEVRTANIFLPDNVSLLNQVSFDLYAQICATDAKRKKEFDGLATLASESLRDTKNVFSAGGFVNVGSIDTGSTLDPLDLLKAKRELMMGSDPIFADFVLMHPVQYVQLNTHADFALGATSGVGNPENKARRDENGDIMRFDGMDIYVTELMPSVGSTSLSANITSDAWTASGHPVIVGQKGLAIGRGEHHGIKVMTEDSRRRHGQWKVVDMSYEHDYLVNESLLYLRAADDS